MSASGPSGPLVLRIHWLFELKFHMEYSVDKQYKYDIIFMSLDQNGHCPYMVKKNMFE